MLTGCQVVALPDASSAPLSPAAAAYRAVWAVAQTAATAVTLPLAIGLVVLLGWVAYLVVNNKTTIEYHEVRRTVDAQTCRRIGSSLHTIFGVITVCDVLAEQSWLPCAAGRDSKDTSCARGRRVQTPI